MLVVVVVVVMVAIVVGAAVVVVALAVAVAVGAAVIAVVSNEGVATLRLLSCPPQTSPGIFHVRSWKAANPLRIGAASVFQDGQDTHGVAPPPASILESLVLMERGGVRLCGCLHC